MINWQKIAVQNGYKDDREMLVDLYINQEISHKTIASVIKVSYGSVLNRLKYYKLPIKKKGGANTVKRLSNADRIEIINDLRIIVKGLVREEIEKLIGKDY